MINDEFKGLVLAACQGAKGIAFDGCHKIYILQDDEQMRLMKSYGYDPLIWADAVSPDLLTEVICGWYEESCGLRFVNSVRTVKGDPNDGFHNVIPQGWDDQFRCQNCYENVDLHADGLCYECWQIVYVEEGDEAFI